MDPLKAAIQLATKPTLDYIIETARTHITTQHDAHGNRSDESHVDRYIRRQSDRDRRSRNLTREQVLFYDWIDGIQAKNGWTREEFAARFSDILKDPLQTLNLWRRRTGVFPSDKCVIRLKELAKFQIIRRVRTFYYPVDSKRFVKMIYNFKDQKFETTKTIIEKENYEYGYIAKRFGNSRVA